MTCQGHSRPLEIMRFDSQHTISQQSSIVTIPLSCTVSKIKRKITLYNRGATIASHRIRVFQWRLVLTTLECCKNLNNRFSHFGTMPECHGPTDRRTDGRNCYISCTVLRVVFTNELMGRRDKNVWLYGGRVCWEHLVGVGLHDVRYVVCSADELCLAVKI